MNFDKKSNLKQRIEDVLQHKTKTLENAYTKSLKELVEELKIYQYELEFQNDELKRIQQELELSRNDYHNLFENAPVGYVIIDEEMNLLDCNQTFRKMLSGKNHQRECGKKMDFRKFIAAGDQDRFHLFFAELIRSQGSGETQIGLNITHDEMIYAQVMGKYSHSGTAQRVLLSLKDITIQQQAQEDLRANKNQYESLVNNIPGITYRCANDARWTMLFVSANVEATSGYTADQLLHNKEVSFMQLIHEEDREKVTKAVLSGIKKKRAWEIEYRLWHKNGSIRWAYEKGRGAYDEKGQVLFLDGFILDITEEKNTENQLYGFFNVNLDLLCIADLEGNFHKINKEWENVLGYSEEEIKSKNFLEFVHPEDIQPTLAAMAKLGENQKVLNFVNRYRSKDGTYRFIEWRSHPNGNLVYAAARDITERKQAEEALRESEEQLKVIFENSLNPILIADDAGYYIKVNEAAAKMFQYSVEQLLKMNIGDIRTTTNPNAAERYHEYLSNGFEIGEFDFFRPDGSWAIAQYHAVRVRENFNLSILSDITDRKRAEEALKVSEERFRNIMASMNDIVYTLDNEQRHTGVYGPWVQQQGLKPEDFLGKTSCEIFGTEADCPHEEANNKALKGEFVIYEWTAATENGSLYFQTSLSPITNAQGETQGLVGIGRNITELKQTEKELKESEERFKALHNASFGGIAIHDKGVIMECNQGLSEMMGYSIDELIDMNGLLLIAPDDRDMVMSKIMAGYEKPYEATGLRKNGEQFPIQLEARNIPYKGKMVRTTEFRDISESKQVEEVRKQLEIAMKTVQFKQNFLANMSHEIRTPLTGMLGMTEILEHTPLDEHQKDYLNTLKTSGRHLNEIIDQVLDFSKLEAGKIRIKPVVFQIKQLINDCIELYRNKIKPEVQIKKHIDPQIPEFVTADRLRLSQVLNNLISNAVKFTSRGSVSVQSRLVSINSIQKECIIKVEVTDTGLGISDAMQEKLFTPFFQIEINDTRGHEGTGLGLAISKEIVGLIGGELGLISKEGKGSTFWFTFPAIIANKPIIPVKEKDDTLVTKKLRILLVEDKLVNQKVVKLMLNSFGYSVTIANHGKQAIELYQPGQFDLILMDIQMPVMDGVTSTRLLKEKYDNLPPIVGLSANAFEGDREKYMKQGMDEYLTKPVKKEDFKELIRKLFQ